MTSDERFAIEKEMRSLLEGYFRKKLLRFVPDVQELECCTLLPRHSPVALQFDSARK